MRRPVEHDAGCNLPTVVECDDVPPSRTVAKRFLGDRPERFITLHDVGSSRLFVAALEGSGTTDFVR